MPQLAIAQIVLKATLAVGLELKIATVMAIAKAIQFVAYVAASMGASKLLQKKMPGFSDASLADRTQMVRSPVSARQIVYGETRVSGTLVYISTTGSKNEYLHLVIALAGHEVEEIGDVYFNDELALTGAGSAASGRFAGYAEIYKKLGSDTQTVETNLQTATSGLTNGQWTSNHRLRGIAYVYVQLTWNEEVWIGGIPNVSAMVKGKKVYDPRTTTTAYSANAALCLRDYLTDTRLGMAMDASEMDDTAFTAAANICDEQVEVKPVTSPATYENRYEANGVLYTSASPDENIGKLLSAMGGLIAYSGGKIVPYAGGYRIPTVTLTEADFAGSVQVQTKTSARDRVNAVKGVFVSAKSEWQPTDFPPLVSSTYYAEDGNIRYYRDVVLPLTTSSSCAQRLARIELRRARQEITMSARFKLDAMQLRAGDTVQITNAKFGWTDKVFEVMDWHFASDGQPPQLTIEMTLRETASAVYDWDVTDEIEMPTTPTTTLPNPFALNAPTNLALTADGTTQLVQADGTALPRIKVSWSAPAEQFIQAGGSVGIDYKESTSTTYLTWATVPGDRTLDYISSDIKIGLGYDVRIYGLSYFQVSTSYVSASVTVVKDTTAPNAPTSLTANVGTGRAVSLDWADNTEADLSEYGVYRNTTGTTPASATTDKIAEVRASRFVDAEVATGTTYYYWVTAYDFLENVSGFSNRAQAIATGITAGSVDTTAPSTPNPPAYSSEATYISSDGTALAQITLVAPAMPSGGVLLTILFRRSGASEWQIANQISTGSISVSIDDLMPGVVYEFAARALSTFDIASAVSTTISRTAPKNTTAPATPTSLTANVGTGRAISLDWADNTEADLSEYGVYRNTTSVTPASANTDKIAEVRASRFVDTEILTATTYYYWVTAYDFLENVSGFSNRAQAIATGVTAGSVDLTPPSTPNAPTYSSETTYLAGDGTALARITLTAPAMPTGGALLTILFRRSGASEWQIGNQIGSGSIAVSIDDLTPGQAYEFAARAISNFDVPSAVSATLSRTAPNYSGSVTAPQNVALTTEGVKPSYVPGTLVFNFATRCKWDSNTQSDFAYYEVKATTSDSDSAVNYSWAFDGPNNPYRTRDTFAFLYNATNSAGFVRVRAVNRSGTASAWVSAGNANGTSTIGTGSISKYNSNDVTTTGIKTGDGSSTRQVNVVYETNEVVTLTGGSTSENVNISLTNRGFVAKPDDGIVVVEDVLYAGFYDSQAAGSTSTNAVVRIFRNDGGTLGAGNLRLSGRFTDYS